MRLVHTSGDVFEIPPPNEIGESALILNGVVLERLLFSDAGGGVVTTGDGRSYKAGPEFNAYCIGILAQAQGRITP
jgi:hypothetical protein